jgi:hypothetical protein
MKTVHRNEILPVGEYESIRDRFRARVIVEKKSRRVHLGDKASCVFENHDTVLLQIQEMLRTERITREAAIAHEIETYNELLGGTNELSCTVMLEVVDEVARDAFLIAAKGIEKCFFIELGGERSTGRAAEDRSLEDRASAVIYLKFALSAGAAAALSAGGPATLGVDHAAYRAQLALDPQITRALGEDLAG